MNTKTDELWAERINQRMKEARNAALREAAEVAHQIEWESIKTILHLIGDDKRTRIQQAILALIEKDEP